MPTVIVTRPKPALDQATKIYQKAGFAVFPAPCFEIQTNSSIQATWLKAESDVWLVLSVHALTHALLIAPDLQPLATTQVIAVGPAVVKAWKKIFDHPITSHPLMNSEGVIDLLKVYQPKSVKILTTSEGRNLIKSYCMDQAISYSQFNTYQRVSLHINQTELAELYEDKNHEKVILSATSGGILQHFINQCSAELKSQVLSSPLVVGAQRIADLAQELGFSEIYLAENPSNEAMSVACLNLAASEK
jgi:uroporphyrinogen-III synthase